jgi:beta-xylosidase
MGGVSVRGEIIHTKRAQQINDFSGLLYGKITPTDIDGVIEYKDKAYVLLEVKYGSKDLPYGQRLALQRIVDDAGKAGKIALALVVNHDVEDTDKSVNVAQCDVREIYYSGEKEWRPPNAHLTVREITDKFLSMVHNGA